jgi:hypothetical protein
LWALIKGLPPESATYSSQRFPPDVEFLATLIERQDAWFDVLLKAHMGAKRVQPPAPLQVRRPDDAPEPERKLVSDPRTIAAWFAKNVGGR